MEFLNQNVSYKDKCGLYKAVESQLIVAKQGSGKKDYIQFSLKKIKQNGRVDALGFSHYFNVGIPDVVEGYKALGVTEKGISEENLKKAKELYDNGDTDYEFTFYGFWWNQPFGGVYKNKETGKVSSETLVFIPCDEDTGLPKPEFCMSQSRLNEILQNYTKVESTVDGPEPSNDTADDDEQKAFEEFIKTRNASK